MSLRNPRNVAEFEALLADPGKYPGNRQEREDFRGWAGARFDSWYERGHALAEAKDKAGPPSNPTEVEYFESNWHPDGPQAYYREKQTEQVLYLAKRVRHQGFEEGVKAAARKAVLDGILDGTEEEAFVTAVMMQDIADTLSQAWGHDS
jgi:hypothetical protein